MALKRKPSNQATGKSSCQPHHASLDHKEDEATEPDPTDLDDEDPVDPDTAYEETKALGDADHEVSVRKSSYFFYLTLCKGHGHDM